MNLLALETSSDACSAALESGGEIIERHVVEPRRHRELLLPFVAALMRERGLDYGSLDGIVLGNGPGSFIGMRIAASVAQGLAFGSSAKLLPVSSLAAIAAEVTADGASQRVLVAQDARMGQAYVAEFERGADQVLRQTRATSLWNIAAAADWPVAAGSVLAGGVWSQHRRLQTMAATTSAQFSDVAHPRARYLIELGAELLRQDAGVPAEKLRPEYVRDEVATPPA